VTEFDEANERGYFGASPDDTPRENYGLQGGGAAAQYLHVELIAGAPNGQQSWPALVPLQSDPFQVEGAGTPPGATLLALPQPAQAGFVAAVAVIAPIDVLLPAVNLYVANLDQSEVLEAWVPMGTAPLAAHEYHRFSAEEWQSWNASGTDLSVDPTTGAIVSAAGGTFCATLVINPAMPELM
jgi:hypothetical protein